MVVYHTSTGQYIGVATFFFEPGLKLDEKSIENGLEGQKCSVGGLFWGWLPPPLCIIRQDENSYLILIPFSLRREKGDVCDKSSGLISNIMQVGNG